ncbi:hypothetical protein [Deinococcus sedimenti]|uniref:Uncharacterized protein n=1 Tax=Deinococcus sedimenti TaxID=1867090 RepID=A0ABQ2S969_9DEIO|nr:hypothetical protein [Deinococcus sedimenti]GGS10200.1 hypothetical protein GCM10008960_40420 [Deinococcus sedimenti]
MTRDSPLLEDDRAEHHAVRWLMSPEHHTLADLERSLLRRLLHLSPEHLQDVEDRAAQARLLPAEYCAAILRAHLQGQVGALEWAEQSDSP